MEYIQKAYKFRLYPNKAQKALISQSLGSCRFVFNHFLDAWNSAYESSKKGLSYIKCSAELPALKQQFPWLSDVDSTCLQTSIRHLDDSFSRFFKGQNERPRFKSKKNPVQSFTSKFTNNNIRIEGKSVRLPKLGLVKMKQSREIQGRIISATVKRTGSGKFFVSILVKEPKPKALPKTKSKIGLDLGVKDLAVLSNGEIILNYRSFSKLETKLAKAQKNLSRKKKGSSNYAKNKAKVAKIHEQIANARLDHLHKVSWNLVKNHDLISMETLDVKGMLERVKLSEQPEKYDKNQGIYHKNISDASMSKLSELLVCKAFWYGKTIVKIDKNFPSTQLCSACGFKNPQLKDVKIRNWECPECHEIHHRDFNASLNILKEGLRLAAFSTVGSTGLA